MSGTVELFTTYTSCVFCRFKIKSKIKIAYKYLLHKIKENIICGIKNNKN